ncbi:MAG: hypothetical protein HBSAPP03_00340 [Phycisphaerae bacterium]|nr:MAG: hypothetical protein HBSAPP03_00340 [Phycisphaerae bacterium]
MIASAIAPASELNAEILVHEHENGSFRGLNRAQLIGRILEINPSATPEFLARFTGPALAEYLDHLTLTIEPRGRGSVWVRRAGPSAIMVRASRP